MATFQTVGPHFSTGCGPCPAAAEEEEQDKLTMQRLVGLHHLGHEHGPLSGQRGQGPQRCGQVDAGDGWVHHELQQLVQSLLPSSHRVSEQERTHTR